MTDLRNLKIILMVADSLNISKVAKNYHLTTSAVSRIISKTEDEINVKLFYRIGNNRLTLTNEGELFVLYANELLSKEAELKSQFLSYTHSPTHINIGTCNFLASHHFKYYVGEFCKKYPKTTFSIFANSNEELYRMLDYKLIDIALFSSDMSFMPNIETYNYFIIKQNVHFYTTNQDYKNFHNIEYTDSIFANVVLPFKNSKLRNYLDTLFSLHGVELIPSIETNNIAFYHDCILHGGHTGLLIDDYIHSNFAKSKLIKLQLEDFNQSINIICATTKPLNKNYCKNYFDFLKHKYLLSL